MATYTKAPDSLWAELKPGDGLLYRSKGLWSFLIRLKTWSDVSHGEMYMGHGLSYASRDGVGVRSYPLRKDGLFAVVRPKETFNASRATEWFNANAVGQKYDWWGLLRFFTIGKQSTDKQFCFELMVRLWRNGGVHPFAETKDADLVSGGEILGSVAFNLYWKAQKITGQNQ